MATVESVASVQQFSVPRFGRPSNTVLDKYAAGGQAGTSSRIENYLGFPSGISGAELAKQAELQAEKFGATLAVCRIDLTGEHCSKATGLA